MSLSVEVSFRSPDIDRWETIARGLARGETGALFQDRVDAFGESAAQKLEDMLERWPAEYFLVIGFERSKTKFWLEFVGGPNALEFALEMSSFLKACNVTSLSCGVIDLSGD
ncbi:hypothetical protein [Marinobacter mangrovi]|uniref:hypothetical protein n=1 Tax=Marinobacter mangrovi TaxID=2803918 RepID=UPI0019323715|nr:hypothetical protein [Marinobacter mangrovi]